MLDESESTTTPSKFGLLLDLLKILVIYLTPKVEYPGLYVELQH